MAATRENCREEYTISWISEFADWNTGGFWDSYYATYYCRRIVSSEKRAIALAQAFANRTSRLRELYKLAKSGDTNAAKAWQELMARETHKRATRTRRYPKNMMVERPEIEWVEVAKNKYSQNEELKVFLP
jgi:hypothetical protein